MPLQDDQDPVAEYKRLAGQQQAPEGPDDPVAAYKQAAGVDQFSRLPPDQAELHRRRASYGQEPGLIHNILQNAMPTARMLGDVAWQGAKQAQKFVSPINMALHPMYNLQVAHDMLAAVPGAIKHTRDVTQRALAGDDVSPGEIAEGWAGGALAALGAAETGMGVLKGRMPGTRGEVTPAGPTEPRVAVPEAAPVQRAASTADAVAARNAFTERTQGESGPYQHAEPVAAAPAAAANPVAAYVEAANAARAQSRAEVDKIPVQTAPGAEELLRQPQVAEETAPEANTPPSFAQVPTAAPIEASGPPPPPKKVELEPIPESGGRGFYGPEGVSPKPKHYPPTIGEMAYGFERQRQGEAPAPAPEAPMAPHSTDPTLPPELEGYAFPELRAKEALRRASQVRSTADVQPTPEQAPTGQAPEEPQSGPFRVVNVDSQKGHISMTYKPRPEVEAMVNVDPQTGEVWGTVSRGVMSPDDLRANLQAQGVRAPFDLNMRPDGTFGEPPRVYQARSIAHRIRAKQALAKMQTASELVQQEEGQRRRAPKQAPEAPAEAPEQPYGQVPIKKLGFNERGAVPIGPIKGNRLAQPSAQEYASLPTETQDVLQHVAVGQKAPFRLPWWNYINQKMWESGRFSRSLESAAQGAGRSIPVSQRALLWFKSALDSPSRIAGGLLEEGAGPGRWDAQGNWKLTGTPSFQRALAPIRGDPIKVSQWRAVLIAERAVELNATGRQTGIPIKSAQQVVYNTPPDVRLAAAQARELLNDGLQYAVDAGGISQHLADYLREEDPWYIPFERAFEGEGAVGKGSGGPLGPRNPLRRFKGSELDVVDPAETIPDYYSRMVRYGDLYRAARSALDLIEANPDLFEGLARKVSSTPAGTGPGSAAETLGQLLSDKALALEGDQLKLVNGKTGHLELYKIDPMFADALRGLGGKEFGLVADLMAAMKKGVTLGVTRNPIFGIIINPIRDALGRPTMSEATTYPGQGGPNAFMATLRQTPEFQKFRSMGGGFGLAAESGGFRATLARSLGGRGVRAGDQMSRQARAAQFVGSEGAASKIVQSIPRLLESLSLPAEQAGRFAEFKTLKRRGTSKYGDEGMSDLEAHVATQEAMGNFAEHGTAPFMRLFAHTAPFMNPFLQGSRAFMGAAARNPGRFALAGLTTITLPTLALYGLNMNDDEITRLRQAPGGYLYWYIRLPWNKDVIFKVPKPFGPGAVFGTAPEHALDIAMGKDPHGTRRMLQDLAKELAQGFEPPASTFARGMITGKDPGTGVPLSPTEQSDNVAAYQEARHQSPLLRRVGRATGVSPAKLQFAARTFGGSSAAEALRAADQVAFGQELPAMRRADYPFVGRLFGRTPSSAVAPVRDIYEESRGPISTLKTIQFMARKGNTRDLLPFLQQHKGELVAGGVGEELTQQLSQIAEAAERFENMQSLSPEQRADKRDAMLRLMVQMAERLHPLLDRVAQPR